MAKVYATPGVYIEEKSAFPNSAVPVATAVPAFIGYTEKAILNKKDITHVPTRISSLGEYLLYFGGGPKTVYDIAPNDDANIVYTLSTGPRFLLFQCIKMFFANGGSDCYVVSIGNYESEISPTDFDNETNENGEKKLWGLKALLKEPEPTMVVIPEAISLGEDACHTLQQNVLKHCGEVMRSRIGILDVYEGDKKRSPGDEDIIKRFREGIGMNNLQWGTAYYPWLHTTITNAEEVNFTNINPETNDKLIAILTTEVKEAEKVKILDAARAQSIRDVITRIKQYNPITPADPAAAKAAKEKFDADVASATKAEVSAKQAFDAATAAEKAGKKTEWDGKKAALNDALIKADIANSELLQAQVAKARGEVDATKNDLGKKQTEAKKAAEEAAKDPGKKAAADKAKTAVETLTTTLNEKTAAYDKAELDAAPDPQKIKNHHQTLTAVSPMYKSIMSSVREKINLLPPSAGMAGVYSMVDNNVGVFQSPANVSVGSVVRPAVNLTNEEQEDLNIPLNGKAVNAIRTFPGKGVLVWGARTLDGNSQDWRYISVRRTVIFIEQSIKYATEPYVFQPNTATTWTNVKAMITNFLTNVWQQGALAGATAEDAFSVHIGLGETMTPVDILDGYMRITVKLAVTRPAEFIVITFEQQMQKS